MRPLSVAISLALTVGSVIFVAVSVSYLFLAVCGE